MLASVFAPQWLVDPMHSVIQWFLSVTGSYGAAVILLTIVIKVITLPLTIYQANAMKRMQVMQPLMKELQAKYKDNPQKQQEETMKLYKEHKANPAAGCLPMLVQMPILWAMFAVVNTFVPSGFATTFLGFNLVGLGREGANMVLLVLSVVIMFAQTWLSMAPNADRSQQVPMLIMPVFFGYITLNMRAAVILYWVVSYIFGLVQTAIYPGFARFQKPKA
ncbi:MAG TPA: YidC/Oxa1 family membrane protein insertase [Symbiobacteriaceae bacterium]|nr:YidC/Oxa1 family membrane protein insertase [Symbiobacteriaceae bacterium]